MIRTAWTLVQHSGWVDTGHAEFRCAVETRYVDPGSLEKVRAAGAVLFQWYEEADSAEYLVNYPPGVTGMIPRCRGTFSPTRIAGLRLYLPAADEVLPLALPADVVVGGGR